MNAWVVPGDIVAFVGTLTFYNGTTRRGAITDLLKQSWSTETGPHGCAKICRIMV